MIEVFADVLCPFTHVGLRRVIAHRQAVGSKRLLHVRAWPLELVNGEPLDAEFVADEIEQLREQVAPDLFTAFDPARFPTTSLPALSLAHTAYGRSTSLGERVSIALRDALFEEGRDVASADVIAEIAAAHNVEGPYEVDRAAIVADWEEGRRRGVQGSPHFFVDDEGFFCPALEIAHVGEHLKITANPARFDEFLTRAFPAA